MDISIYNCREFKCEIDTLANWTRPKLPVKQWKDGRSAKELAKYFIAYRPHLPNALEDILKEKLYLDSTASFKGIPECKTALPGKGEGRNHDMLIIGDEHNVVIGVEGKVDETLGTVISQMSFKTDNSKERLQKMYNGILGTSEKIDEIIKKELSYQLLSASYATLKEAYKIKGKGDAVLLIVTFLNGHPMNYKMQKNHQAVEDFKKALDPFRQKNDSFHLPNYPGMGFWIEEVVVS